MPFAKTRAILLRGTRAGQVAAASVQEGSLYFVTDEGVIEQSTGAAWVSYSGAGGVGTQGADGAPGQDGEPGEDGWPGVPGAQGNAGATGATGPAGPPGPAGPEGDAGEEGAPGPAGPPGATGADGAAGSAGLTGPPGWDGSDGDDGAPGPPGPAGAAGSDGSAGSAGPGGPPGAEGEPGDEGFVAALVQGSTTPRTIGMAFDGQGSAPTVGVVGYVVSAIAGTLTGWDVVGDPSGSAVVDVWKAAGAIPTNANSIAAAAKPTLSAAQLASSVALSTWTTTTVLAGDVFGFEVESASGVTRLTVTLRLIPTV